MEIINHLDHLEDRSHQVMAAPDSSDEARAMAGANLALIGLVRNQIRTLDFTRKAVLGRTDIINKLVDDLTKIGKKYALEEAAKSMQEAADMMEKIYENHAALDLTHRVMDEAINKTKRSL